MRQLFRLLCALVCVIGFSLPASAQLTTITASSIKMAGVPVATGTVTFVPTNLVGLPIAITAGGSLYDAQGFSASIVNGAISGTFQVPDACEASATTPGSEIFYQITVLNSTTKKSFSLTRVQGVCGANWALDSYVPTQGAPVTATGLMSGMTVPDHCLGTSIFYTQGSPAGAYLCVAGVYVQLSANGSSLSLPHTTSLLKGDGNGGAAIAQSGTDYPTVASVTSAESAAAAAQTTASAAIPATQKGAASGVASLDASGRVPQSQLPLPSLTDVQTYLDFKDAPGSTAATDKIGSNNCTLGTNAPTFNGQGLVFSAANQNCSFPSALNSYKTFYFVIYINPITTGPQTTSGYTPIMSSSLGNSGKNVLLTYAPTSSTTPTANSNIFALDVYNAANITSSPATLSGFHVLAYGCGTSAVDHLYIDGYETSYNIQNSGGSCGAQSSGNLFLSGNSAAPWSSTSGFLGTYYGFAASTDAHTSAQVLANSNLLKQAVATAGIPTTPVQVNVGNAILQAGGDSIMCGQGLATPCTNTTPSPNTWPQNLTLTNQPTYTTVVNAISGISLSAVSGSEPNRACIKARTNGGVSLYLMHLGTNEFSLGNNSATNPTPAVVWQRLIGLKNTMMACGATHVFVGTMLSRGGNDAGGTSFDTDKNVLNRLIYSQWKQAGFAGVLPFAIDPVAGADGANVSSTYFQPDHIHPTQTLQNRFFALASNALNYVFGATDTQPHVVSSLPYTQLASDGAITLSGLSAGGDITATTCQSPIGVTFRINNPQSAQTVTWTPLSGEPANGTTAAITIPANGFLKAKSVPNDPSVAGCSWSVTKGSL